MNNYKNEIKEIIKIEFNNLLATIKNDFKRNYEKKKHNFLLNNFDSNVIAYMVFVSSFESKSWNAIQECARKIAILKYWHENVPNIINPNNLVVNKEDFKRKFKEQVLVTNIDIENKDLQAEIQRFLSENSAEWKWKNRKEASITQIKLSEVKKIAEKFKTNQIYKKPVDLAFYDGKYWNFMEIKAWWDLDSSNAPGNAKKMLTIYAWFNFTNTRMYFSTIYNKSWEKSNWSGIIKKYLYEDVLLIGSNFWEKILPDWVDFNNFTKIYKDTLDEIKLKDEINKLIESVK